jgi:hypothetical protein
MQIGVAFPTVEIGADLSVVNDFVQAAEDLGYDHVRILDHVLGADPQHHPEVPVFYYTHESVTHEPFTLMAYLAARDPNQLGMTGSIRLGGKQPDEWVAEAKAWEQMGASHVSINTAGKDFTSPQAHLDALRRFREEYKK